MMNGSPDRGDTAGDLCHPSGVPLPHMTIPTRVHTPTRVNTRAYGMPPLSGLGAVRYGTLSRNPIFYQIITQSVDLRTIQILKGCHITDAGVNLRHGRGDTAKIMCHPFGVPMPHNPFPPHGFTHLHGFTPRACDIPPLSGLGAVHHGPLSRNPKFC